MKSKCIYKLLVTIVWLFWEQLLLDAEFDPPLPMLSLRLIIEGLQTLKIFPLQTFCVSSFLFGAGQVTVKIFGARKLK